MHQSIFLDHLFFPQLLIPLSLNQTINNNSYRLLDDEISEEHKLWAIARVMSDEEFLAAAEERTLENKCGNPLCSHTVSPDNQPRSKGKYKIDTTEKKVYAPVPGPLYCSDPCSDFVASFAVKLGSAAQAFHRFDALLEQVQERRAFRAGNQSNISEKKNAQNRSSPNEVAENVQGLKQQHISSSSSIGAKKLKSALKKSIASEYAAGTSKMPIMTAEVKV